ncbi:low affinity iron permease family protein [Rhizobium sp. LjRoot254]|uniref:low affinity iron permease family protein n=1 Tax=Rhizobium sp. LjRoot254 TaxID=3342297 RepID=UPI003ECED530
MNAAFSKFSNAVSHVLGKPVAFIIALSIVGIWAVSGPFFGFSEVWQLIINTGTTIVTFLMIFVLQNSQNRYSEALQAKLDELILTSKRAENKFIGIENLDEEELRELRRLIDEKACEDEEEGDKLNSRLDETRNKMAASAAHAAE